MGDNPFDGFTWTVAILALPVGAVICAIKASPNDWKWEPRAEDSNTPVTENVVNLRGNDVDYHSKLLEAYEVAAGDDYHLTREERAKLIRGLGFGLVLHEDHNYRLFIDYTSAGGRVRLTDSTSRERFSRPASSITDYLSLNSKKK